MKIVNNSLRICSQWLAGPNMRELASDIWRRRIQAADSAMDALHNRHADTRRCFVIGNGPSLKAMNLAPLSGEFSIGANSFYKHPQADAVNLRFLCIFDPHFMSDQPRSVEWHRTIERQV